MKYLDNLSLDYVEALLKKMQDVKVLVVGEAIIDTYEFTDPMGLGSKSAIVSVRSLFKESYAGGSVAIANHLSALGCECTVFYPDCANPEFNAIINNNLKARTEKFIVKNWRIPHKIRFVNKFKIQKIFEINYIDDEIWGENNSIDSFKSKLDELIPKFDMILVADFGHGFINRELAEYIGNCNIFKAVNVQSNSANLGFNFFHKFPNYDYLSIDEREFRLAMINREHNLEVLIKNSVADKKIKTPFSITMGANGSIYVDSSANIHKATIYNDEVVDTTGAGDAYLSITSILAYLGKVHSELIPILGNIYAGLKVEIVGNKFAVGKQSYLDKIKYLKDKNE